MKCEKFHDEILLYLGQPDLPVELKEHIAVCDSCRTFYEELNEMGSGLGTDRDFYPNELETEGFLKQLNDELDRMEPASFTSLSWYKLAGVAASVLLVVGISIFGNLFKRNNLTNDSFDANTAVIYYDDYRLALENSEIYELSDDMFYLLGTDYTSRRTYNAAGQLLEDLSEEELKYLEENFDVGDLL